MSTSTQAAETKTSWVPLIAVVVTVLVLGVLFALMRSGAVEAPPRMPVRYILPPDFAGPVKIYYDMENADPIPVEDGVRIIEIPPSGIVLTSSDPDYGQAVDEFLRATGDGELESLGFHYIRDRKSGMTGDNKEYFLRPEELAQRDTELVRHGVVTQPDGLPKYDVPYVLFTVRDDF